MHTHIGHRTALHIASSHGDGADEACMSCAEMHTNICSGIQHQCVTYESSNERQATA